MACSGPSKDFSMIRGEDAHQKIIALLKETYNVDRPHSVIGVIKGKEVEVGFGRRSQAEWDEQSQQLKEILQELVWTSDASSW